MFDIFFEFMVSKYGLKQSVSGFKLQIILIMAKSLGLDEKKGTQSCLLHNHAQIKKLLYRSSFIPHI
jgi:hypothetical protein